MTRTLLIVIVTCLLCRCVTPHLPSTHFTPLFTQRGQIDAEASAGLSSCNLNAGYSPIKHIAIFGNVQSFLGNTSDNYQRSAEGAIGFYHQVRKIYFGVNAGYGQGAYGMKVKVNEEISHTGFFDYWDVTKGNFSKYTGQAYISFLDDPDDPRIQVGLSFKFNYYQDNYTHALNPTDPNLAYAYASPSPYNPWLHVDENVKAMNSAAEFCFFIKFYLSRNFYVNFQLGYRPGGEDFNYIYEMKERRIILRAGVGINVSTLRKPAKGKLPLNNARL